MIFWFVILISANVHISGCTTIIPLKTTYFGVMLFSTFLLGLAVNFLGYIPPGNINLTLIQIAINRGVKQATYFIGAFSCIEFFITWFIMNGATWLTGQLKLHVVIDWVMITLFGTLAIITWVNRKKAPIADYTMYDSLKYGLILGFVNPMQIPFWLVCGTYFVVHGWVVISTFNLIIFSLGAATGAFLCLLAYAKLANYFLRQFKLSAAIINTAIAMLFLSFAIYHLIKQLSLLL